MPVPSLLSPAPVPALDPGPGFLLLLSLHPYSHILHLFLYQFQIARATPELSKEMLPTCDRTKFRFLFPAPGSQRCWLQRAWTSSEWSGDYVVCAFPSSAHAGVWTADVRPVCSVQLSVCTCLCVALLNDPDCGDDDDVAYDGDDFHGSHQHFLW